MTRAPIRGGRPPVTHELKTWPIYFEPVRDGRKTFEVRWNDRDYRVGDTLHLREWAPQAEDYTGRSVKRKVTYILDDVGVVDALHRGYCVMGLGELK